MAELREVPENDYLDDSYRFRPLDEGGSPKRKIQSVPFRTMTLVAFRLE